VGLKWLFWEPMEEKRNLFAFFFPFNFVMLGVSSSLSKMAILGKDDEA